MTPAVTARQRVGLVATLVILLVYGGLALGVDPVQARRTPVNPSAPPGFQSDEATYYLMGQSLAHDGDLAYRAEDIQRTLQEFPQGPVGMFLKRGVDITGVAETDQQRLFFGKSFIYPLVCAPFVWLFGTNGFYLVNTGLLALAFLCSYLFLSARSGIVVSVLLAGAFVFATVLPVYWSWITPELFNCAVGLTAFFFWLYKEVAPQASSARTAWLRRPASDLTSAFLIGILTFSKPTNALLAVPVVLWLAWKRRWTQAFGVCVVWTAVTAALFGVNIAVTGDWNFQGGLDRRTCSHVDRPFPFAEPGVGFEVCDERSTDVVQTNVYFDPEVFWQNLGANLKYFVVGRNSGAVAYFFPCVFCALLMLVAGRRRESWQWLVLGSVIVQALVFIITQPYSFYGGGGSVGNRYFMGGYGLAVFLFPPVQSVLLAVVPWIVGGIFMAPLILSPFDTSIRPMDHTKQGALRILPVELTNMNDLPLMTEPGLHVYWYGDDGVHQGFQIYRLDDNSFLQEADKLSFWTRADSRAEMLIKAVGPVSRMQFRISAGAVPTHARIEINGEGTEVNLGVNETTIVQLALPEGFKYKKDRVVPAYVWRLNITSGPGFVPAEVEPGSTDTRPLAVRVLPLIVDPAR